MRIDPVLKMLRYPYGYHLIPRIDQHHDRSEQLFELQLLSEQSETYKTVQNNHFGGLPIKIIRFKVPSYHKSQLFNANGYRGYIIHIGRAPALRLSTATTFTTAGLRIISNI